ncbi:MAG: nuclease-related domain-containing protein [Limisphaerales bacterium]
MPALKQLLIPLIPIVFLLALAVPRFLQRRIQKVRLPVKDKLLRPPGESLRVRIEEMDDKGNYLTMWLLAFPLIALSSMSHLHWAFPALFSAVGCGVLSLYLFRVFKRRSDHWIGFQGERAVAEELNQLMRKGCIVFHDLLMTEKSNIDHVIVAPTGVFVVETKTRRKRRARQDREDHKVIFDGKALHFPHGTDKYGLAQTDRNAAWLADQLSKALAEPITVTPILTFPGWYIERTGRGKVNVVHHKEIAKVIASDLGSPLNEKQMKQISAWLEDRCRNVEF